MTLLDKWNTTFKTEKKIVLVAVLVAIGSIVLNNFLFDQNKRQLKARLAASLSMVVNQTNEEFKFWYAEKKLIIENMAADWLLIGMVEQLLQGQHDPKGLLQQPALKKICDFYKSKLDVQGYQDFFIINKDRLTLASMQERNVGSVNLIEEQRPELLKQVFSGETKLVSNIVADADLDNGEDGYVEKPLSMFITTPIKNSLGEVIAVLALRINYKYHFDHLVEQRKIGLSGETYAFDSNGFFITSSRFDKQLKEMGMIAKGQPAATIRILNPGTNLFANFKKMKLKINQSQQWSLTKMAASALKGEQGFDMEGYRDYRGVRVVGAWIWNKELEIGLATEEDSSEAFRSYYQIVRTSMIELGLSWLLFLILLFFIVITKIRAEREIISREEKLHALLETSSEGIIAINDNGIILDINGPAEFVFMASRQELLKQSIRLVIPNMEVGTTDTDSSYLGLGRRFEGKTKDGHELDLEVTMVDVTARNTKQYLLFIRKHKEEVISTEELELITNQAYQAKRNFLSTVSHEFRTPMNAIIGMNQLLQNTELTPQQHDYSNRMQHATQSLLRMIDNILDFSKLGTEEIKILSMPFTLQDFIHKIIKNSHHDCNQKALELIFYVDSSLILDVNGDAKHLEQVIMQLIGNAIKYTNKGEVKIEFLMEKEEEQNFLLKVVVSDTGIGIAKENMNKLFKMFNQIDASNNRHFGGLGMGLALSKKIVGKMNGEIGLVSEIDKGSSFYFTALLQKQSQTRLLETGSIGEINEYQLVVIEPNQSARSLLEIYLKEAGGQVVLFESIDVFLNQFDQLEHQSYKETLLFLTISNEMSPKGSGIDLIRKAYNYQKHQIIIVQSLIEYKDADKVVMRYGSDHFLGKPVCRQRLTALFLMIKKNCNHVEQGIVQQQAGLEKGACHQTIKWQAINATSAIKQLRGNEDLFGNLLVRFSEDHSHTFQKINEAIFHQEWRVAQLAVHSLKGSAGNISAQDLFKSADRLEKQLKQATINTDLVQRDLITLRDKLQDVWQEVEYVVELKAEREKKEGHLCLPKNELLVIIDRIHQLLKERDVEAKTLFDHYRMELENDISVYFFQQMDQAIKQYDFVEAEEVLSKALEELSRCEG